MNPIKCDEVRADLSLYKVAENIINPGEDRFSVSMADELLKTTRQYEVWKSIRQKDPSKAGKISSLVLERHAYVAGKAPLNESGRRHFDELTDRIAKEGIYLYKSHQFKNPIFCSSSYEREVAKEIQRFDQSSAYDEKNNPANSRVSELGTQFDKKDCYEFLAGILETSGIKYYGPGGVASTLIQKAKAQGKNPYALFNGEGVTELLCSKPLTISVDKVSKDSYEKIWNKLEPHLKEGAILSYSSDRFGHTGVVGKHNENWVYVNSSGKRGEKSSYRVLEENLKGEILGWLRRAERNGTFLEITLGNVDRDIAENFSQKLFAAKYKEGAEINLLA
jgi:hypothetical protein